MPGHAEPRAKGPAAPLSLTRVEIAPGYSISRVVKGGWQLAGGPRPIDRARALRRHAPVRGGRRHDLRLRGHLHRRRRADRRVPGRVPAGAGGRPEVQVHTKYVPDLEALRTLGKADVERAVDRSLRRLGVERLDLVQFHWWDYAGAGLDRRRAAGWTSCGPPGRSAISGSTNWGRPHLAQILAAGVPVVSHQVQYSVVDRQTGGRDGRPLPGARHARCSATGRSRAVSSRSATSAPPRPRLRTRTAR